jgi:hypothetical protein
LEIVSIAQKAIDLLSELVPDHSELDKLRDHLAQAQKPKSFFSAEDFILQTTDHASVMAKIRERFRRSPNQIFTIKDFQAEIPETPNETIRATLSRLARKEFIVSPERGKYIYRFQTINLNDNYDY